MDKDVGHLGVIGVLVLTRVQVEALDVDFLIANGALPASTVAHKDDLFARLHIEGALVGAKNHVHGLELLVEILVDLPQDLHGFLKGSWAAAPAVVGLLLGGRRTGVALNLRALEVGLNALQANLKALSLSLCFLESDVPLHRNVFHGERAQAAICAQGDVFDFGWVESNDSGAHRIDSHLVVAENDQVHVEWNWGEHSPLPGGDGINCNELRLDDLLKISDLLVESPVVVDQPMAIVLDPDVVLQTEGHGCPRVGLELGEIDEEVRPRHRLRCEHGLSKAIGVGEGDLALSALVKQIAFRFVLLSTAP